MDTEKKEFGKWWMWLLFLLVITGIVGAALNSAGIFTKTVVERKVFEQSFQRSEGLKQQISVYEADLAGLRARLNDTTLSPSVKAGMMAQKASIESQLRAARSRQ